MANIQSNVNQLIGMAGLASQLPIGQQFAEKQNWKHSWNKMKKTEAGLGINYKNPVVTEKNAPAYEQAITTREKMLERGESQLTRNPSKFNYEGQMKGRKYLKSMEDALAEFRKKGIQQIEQNANLKRLKEEISHPGTGQVFTPEERISLRGGNL